jgi:galactokinase/mevalonate kinase-like predicted kinase
MLTVIQALPLIEALVSAGIGTAQQIAGAWRDKNLLDDATMNATLEAIAKNADARAAQAAKDAAGQ